MIMAKPAHTMPRIRAEKLRGAPVGRDSGQLLLGRGRTGQGLGIASPSPMPELSRTPQENHMAEDRVSASSSSSSLFTLNRPKGLRGVDGRWERGRERWPCPTSAQLCPPHRCCWLLRVALT